MNMNIFFRNKNTNKKIKIEDFFHVNKDGNLEQHKINICTKATSYNSLVPTPTYISKEYSLQDILLDDDWEIWCDRFWVNESQLDDIEVILNILFKQDDPKVLTIATKLLKFYKHNKLIEMKNQEVLE